MPTFTAKGVRLLKRERDALQTSAQVLHSMVSMNKLDKEWAAAADGLVRIADMATTETHHVHQPLPGQLPLPFAE